MADQPKLLPGQVWLTKGGAMTEVKLMRPKRLVFQRVPFDTKLTAYTTAGLYSITETVGHRWRAALFPMYGNGCSIWEAPERFATAEEAMKAAQDHYDQWWLAGGEFVEPGKTEEQPWPQA